MDALTSKEFGHVIPDPKKWPFFTKLAVKNSNSYFLVKVLTCPNFLDVRASTDFKRGQKFQLEPDQNPIRTWVEPDKSRCISHKTDLWFPQEFLNGIFNFGSLCQYNKQGLFLLGDMAIVKYEYYNLWIFLFDEFLPVFLVTGYFIEIMADLGGQSQYKNCSPVMYNPQYSTRSFSLLTFLIGGNRGGPIPFPVRRNV